MYVCMYVNTSTYTCVYSYVHPYVCMWKIKSINLFNIVHQVRIYLCMYNNYYAIMKAYFKLIIELKQILILSLNGKLSKQLNSSYLNFIVICFVVFPGVLCFYNNVMHQVTSFVCSSLACRFGKHTTEHLS